MDGHIARQQHTHCIAFSYHIVITYTIHGTHIFFCMSFTGYQGLPFEGVFVESHVEVFNLTRPFLALLNDLVPTFSEAWVTVTESCRRDHLKYQENNDDS